MKFEDIIKSIAEGYTKAWANWDVELMLSYLSTEVIIQSPKITKLYPENNTGELIGNIAAKEYWLKLGDLNERENIEQLDIVINGREIITTNQVNGRDIKIKETIMVNEYGKIGFLKYEYI